MNKRTAIACASGLMLMGCATPQPVNTLYEIPYQGQSYPVVARYDQSQTLAQARADGTVIFEVVHPKRAMRCDGSVTDCRNTLRDLVDRVERLGDGS